MTEQSPRACGAQQRDGDEALQKQLHSTGQEVALSRDGGTRQGNLVSAVRVLQSMCSCTCFSFSCFYKAGRCRLYTQDECCP